MVKVVVLLLVASLAVVLAQDVKHLPVMMATPPDRNVTQLIQAMGYPVEQHFVTTSDGYILSVQRIPYGKKTGPSNSTKPAIFLQHGLFDASSTWVNNFPDQSLAFILADLGYDVWMGNARGNRYSHSHVTLDTKDAKFWEFSYDEMSLIDLPTMIEYAMNKSGNKVLEAYIGHSQGTVMGFGCFSSDNCSVSGTFNIADKIKTYVALAPAALVGQVTAPFLQFIAKSHIDVVLKWFGIHEFAPSNDFMRWLIPNLCDQSHPFIEKICWNVLCASMGCDTFVENINMTRLSVYVDGLPAGTSTQNMMHWSQAVEFDLFRKYDYGSKELNQKHYKSDEPPRYDLMKLNVDTLIYHGGYDALADPQDVADLIKMLNPTRLKKVSLQPTYGHLDYVWSYKAARDVYEDIVDYIRKK